MKAKTYQNRKNALTQMLRPRAVVGRRWAREGCPCGPALRLVIYNGTRPWSDEPDPLAKLPPEVAEEPLVCSGPVLKIA